MSYRGYENGGGGEKFLHQTAVWAIQTNLWNVVWISFVDHTLTPYEKFSISKSRINETSYIRYINIPGYDSDHLTSWLALLRPNVIHHQGHFRKEIFEVAKELNIPMITGYHFWSGAVVLNNKTFNKNIIDNIDLHHKDSQLDTLAPDGKFHPLVYAYACSSFLRNVVQKVTGVDISTVITPNSESCLKVKWSEKNKYVTQINLHPHKGGEIFLHLLLYTDLPLLGVISENDTSDLYQRIKDAVFVRKFPTVLMDHTNDIRSVYDKTRILLVPTLVDETFCRVVNEGMMSGIPIVTTGKGAISDYVKSAVVIRDEDHDIKSYDTMVTKRNEIWSFTLVSLYSNIPKLKQLSIDTIEEYKNVNEKKSRNAFLRLMNTITNTRKRNIAIFVPWCDQGLGIQAREYTKTLISSYNVHIFSFHSYFSVAKNKFQKDSSEWDLNVPVYYSDNNREQVTDSELATFITQYNIGQAMIIETCWFRIFQIAALLKSKGIRVVAIPNIEIVRKHEIIKHKIFDLIGCNNQLTYDLLSSRGLKCYNLGYSIPPNTSPTKKVKRKLDNSLSFVCIGGTNAFSRKQVLEVCQAFARASGKCNGKLGVSLTVTIQNNIDARINNYRSHKNITIIDSHLKYGDILRLYDDTDITIHVSKHEGLGLGFYESVSRGKPVLTLNTLPHTEIIKDGVNGWVIDCEYVGMHDNENGIVKSAIFDIDTLANKIVEIYRSIKNIQEFRSASKTRILKDYEERFNYVQYQQRLIDLFEK